jgi:hypothetical protein
VPRELTLDPGDPVRMEEAARRRSVQEGNSSDEKLRAIGGTLSGSYLFDRITDARTLCPILRTGSSTQDHPLLCTFDVRHYFAR